MHPTPRATTRSRVTTPCRVTTALAAAAVMLLVAALGACAPAKPNPSTDQKAMDAITHDIQTALANRPDVVSADVTYQNTLDASQRVDVDLKVKPGTDFEPVIDDALRMIWQSKLNPLRSIRIGVIDAQNLQRGDNRRVDAVTQKAALDARYGARPR